MKAVLALVGALIVGAAAGWFWTDIDVSMPTPSHGEGSTFPDLPLAGGRHVSLAETRGKVVFINIWAEWCGPCVQELPSIQRLSDRVAGSGQVEFVLIGWRSDRQQAMQMLSRLGIRLQHYTIPRRLTEDESDALFSGRGGIPRTFILDKQGVVREIVVGSRDWTQAEGMLRDLAAE